MIDETVLVIIYIFAFLIGTSVFSFVNVLIYRVPKKLPFARERSMCPQCGKTLKPYDMIPIISYLLLGGKCRFCKTRISPRYALIELLGGILGILTVFYYGFLAESVTIGVIKVILVFALLALLTAIAWIDLDTMEIPNGLVIAVLICGILSMIAGDGISIGARAIGLFCVSVPLLLIALWIPGAFGGGDIKLMAALGVFLGYKLTLLTFVIAVLLGGGYGIWLLARKKVTRKEHFAFGPFLCIGAMAALFWGNELIQWYFGLLII